MIKFLAYLILFISLFCLILSIFTIFKIEKYKHQLKKEDQDMIDKYYQYIIDREYSVYISSNSYTGICEEIEKYQNKIDTLYVNIIWIVCNGNKTSFNALLKVVRKLL